MKFVYVDNSNVWIEGMYVSAVHKGLATSLVQAHEQSISDGSWRVDFGRLYELVRGESAEIGRAALFGSRPPANDSLWEVARRRGFEPLIYDRNLSNQEKKVDTSIVTEIMSDSYEHMRLERDDEVILLAGDADYVPTAQRVMQRGFRFSVMFWQHASQELRDACTQFLPMDNHLEELRLS